MSGKLALINEKLATADLPYQHLRLAAYLGNQIAKDRLGINDLWPIENFRDWIWQLSQFKKPIQVLTCLVAVETALPVFKECQEAEQILIKKRIESYRRYDAEDDERQHAFRLSQADHYESIKHAPWFIEYANGVSDLLAVVEKWLIDPYDDQNNTAAYNSILSAKHSYQSYWDYYYECGSCNDERTLEIVYATYQTIIAVTWSRARLSPVLLNNDYEELIAKAIDGPALATLNTVESARLALTISKKQMRELISVGVLSRLLKIS